MNMGPSKKPAIMYPITGFWPDFLTKKLSTTARIIIIPMDVRGNTSTMPQNKDLLE